MKGLCEESNSMSSDQANYGGPSKSVFERLDDAIAFLVHDLGVNVVQLKDRADVYDHIHSVTKTLADAVNKKKIQNLDCIKK